LTQYRVDRLQRWLYCSTGGQRSIVFLEDLDV
jgi:hypothetical protein